MENSESVSSAVSQIDFSPIITALTTTITPADIIIILASIVGVGLLFVLMWFGVRKLMKIFSNAVTKGRMTI